VRNRKKAVPEINMGLIISFKVPKDAIRKTSICIPAGQKRARIIALRLLALAPLYVHHIPGFGVGSVRFPRLSKAGNFFAWSNR
ncbi:hypothetical protein, partial [uncultured Corynebacterium sp.]|uniref:hypothetical protein n=1 Tax=uncultured Corynebacterium sp. TaxID=159447 RepID=UPI00259778D3